MNPKTESIKELLSNAIEKLEKQMKTYDEAEKEHMDILKAFGLETLIYKIPLELFSQNDIVDYNFIHQNVVENVNEESCKYFITQLEKNIAVLQSLNSSFTKHQKSMTGILEQYKEEYKAKSEDANQDLLNISSLQTSVHKLQAEILQANEQQEQKKSIISKFEECSQIKTKIDKCKAEEKVLMKEMERCRLLPPDLNEAQKKLDQLSEKYRQISDEFKNIMQKGY